MGFGKAFRWTGTSKLSKIQWIKTWAQKRERVTPMSCNKRHTGQQKRRPVCWLMHWPLLPAGTTQLCTCTDQEARLLRNQNQIHEVSNHWSERKGRIFDWTAIGVESATFREKMKNDSCPPSESFQSSFCFHFEAFEIWQKRELWL